MLNMARGWIPEAMYYPTVIAKIRLEIRFKVPTKWFKTITTILIEMPDRFRK